MVTARLERIVRYVRRWRGTGEGDESLGLAPDLPDADLKRLRRLLDQSVEELEVAERRKRRGLGRRQQIEIDSRSSDAIALAVRVKTPIFVDENVMRRAGFKPDEDIENEKQNLKIKSYFPSSFRNKLKRSSLENMLQNGVRLISIQDIPYGDWATSWKQFFKPFALTKEILKDFFKD